MINQPATFGIWTLTDMHFNSAISSFENYIRSDCAEEYGENFEMPKHKIVCPTCQGEGSHGPGWVFTGSDRYEMGHEFDEMMLEIKAGTYNVPCEQCKGQNVINEVEVEALGKDLKTKWANWLQEIYSLEAMERQERMMGA